MALYVAHYNQRLPGCPSCSDSDAGSSAGTPPSTASTVRPLGTPKFMRGEVNASKYKTQICVFHASGEDCPYAPNCAFAHGEEELRNGEDVAPEHINTLPRTLQIHQEWCRTVKFVPKTGPGCDGMVARLQMAPPPPSFLARSAPVSPPPPTRTYVHCPYPPAALYLA